MKTVSVNGRDYRWPKEPLVVICCDGSEPAYMEIAMAKGLMPNLKAGLERTGRSMDAVDRMIEIKLSFDPDADRALQDTRFWGALALSPEEKMNVEDPLQMEKMADALPIERVATRWIVTSEAAQAIERIRPYVDMGFNHLVFHAPGHDQARFLKYFSERLLPLLKKTFG